ncbi:MAG: hypothetical protein B6226_04335 [Candidatus Cloacimonetes bacterium 4572_65]|nr:MAG: hypothetical protein B6226_04335 [Candidatus Cloacimonetes bacterium 4572_65]
MRYIKAILHILIVLIAVVGCSDGGKIRIINQTSFNIYAEIDGSTELVEGNSASSFNVDTDDKVFLLDDGETSVELGLEGETYKIFDAYEEHFTPTTTVKVTPNKTTKIYCTPTHASLKFYNNFVDSLYQVSYKKIDPFMEYSWFDITLDTPVGYDEFGYIHLAPNTADSPFFYNFRFYFKSGLIVEEGDGNQGITLGLDEQFIYSFGGKDNQ